MAPTTAMQGLLLDGGFIRRGLPDRLQLRDLILVFGKKVASSI